MTYTKEERNVLIILAVYVFLLGVVAGMLFSILIHRNDRPPTYDQKIIDAAQFVHENAHLHTVVCSKDFMRQPVDVGLPVDSDRGVRP